MPELLLELFSEEIPARFQRRAALDLKKAVTDALVESGLSYESAAGFATPRRLALSVTDIPARSPDTSVEKKGPRVGAPDQAVAGFLRGAGLASVEEAQIHADPKKGRFYVAVIEKKGLDAVSILAKILPGVVNSFPWAKPMRWGAGRVRWVRPLRAITATFGCENDEPEIIRFDVAGLQSGQTTYGHRFLAPQGFKVKRFSDYAQGLEKARVVLDLDRRMDIIRSDAEHLAFAQGLSLVDDPELVEEVAGLVEWPVVMMGAFDAAFLELPEEVVITTIKTNQKCFCLRDGQSGKLTNRFLLTANIEASDGGKLIVAGNERVIAARLADAMFFYNNDLAAPLEDRLPRLKDIVFHQKLGSQAERVERLVKLAAEIAPVVAANVEDTKRAALLAKADLVSEMVVEFPSLQGKMGRCYALAQGEKPEIATAIEMHYKPVGPTDAVPTQPVSIAVALADKLDMLSGFWAIDEKPTGSRDPFGLRRAALGVIRILVENEIRYELIWPLKDLLDRAGGEDPMAQAFDLFIFLGDRLKVMLRDQGVAHDIVDAVFLLGDLSNRDKAGAANARDIFVISRRAIALSKLITTETGQNLLAGYRRAVNILVDEENRDSTTFFAGFDSSLGSQSAELELATTVESTNNSVVTSLAANDYAGAVAALAKLREPVDAFFEQVLVNDPDPEIRKNRLNLLARLRDTMHMVADFSKIEG